MKLTLGEKLGAGFEIVLTLMPSLRSLPIRKLSKFART